MTPNRLSKASVSSLWAICWIFHHWRKKKGARIALVKYRNSINEKSSRLCCLSTFDTVTESHSFDELFWKCSFCCRSPLQSTWAIQTASSVGELELKNGEAALKCLKIFRNKEQEHCTDSTYWTSQQVLKLAVLNNYWQPPQVISLCGSLVQTQ